MLFEFFDEFESTSWVNQGSVWDIISLGHSIPPPIIISDQLPIDLNDRMIKSPLVTLSHHSGQFNWLPTLNSSQVVFFNNSGLKKVPM